MEYRARGLRKLLFAALGVAKRAARFIHGGQWIVASSLPEENQEVLVLDSYNDYYLMEMRDGRWYCTTDNSPHDDIKYWRRLPATPIVIKLEKWSAQLEK